MVPHLQYGAPSTWDVDKLAMESYRLALRFIIGLLRRRQNRNRKLKATRMGREDSVPFHG